MNTLYLFVTICIGLAMNIDKDNPIKSKNWCCINHPGCMYSIPCDCQNCVAFEKMLSHRIQPEVKMSNPNQIQKLSNRSHESSLE